MPQAVSPKPTSSSPTSSSWLNLVERRFRDLTQQRLRRGSFHHVKELIRAIKDYVDNNNQNPRVFVWSASVEQSFAEHIFRNVIPAFEPP
jgi:hypothetical protein